MPTRRASSRYQHYPAVPTVLIGRSDDVTVDEVADGASGKADRVPSLVDHLLTSLLVIARAVTSCAGRPCVRTGSIAAVTVRWCP
jgi:hypothetical protein